MKASLSSAACSVVPSRRDSTEVLQRFHEGLPIVQSLALALRRSCGRWVELEDLVSHGQIGLLEAARRYECERGVPFRVFAQFRIRGAMLDGIRQWSRTNGLSNEPGADPESTDSAVAPSPSPEHCASHAQLLQLVEQSLASFPIREAWLIRRHYFEGESLDRVADELLASKSWTSRLHTRAVVRLTVALQHLGD